MRRLVKTPDSPQTKTKGELTRDRIIEAAAPVFNQHGFEGSSLSRLMEATGLQKGGIYRHFGSKEELAVEAFDYTWDAVWNTRLEHVDECKNAFEKLVLFISNFVERKPPVPGGCPVLNTAIESDDGNPVLRARASKALHAWSSCLERLIEQGKQESAIRSDVDPKVVATVIISSLEGALMLSRLQRSKDPLRIVQSQLNEYLSTKVRV